MNFLPPESETGAFINFLPEELPSPLLKKQVKIWMEEREYVIRDGDESLVFQVGLSFVAAFFYRIPLSMGPVDCFSLQAYALGRFGAQFLDDDDLSLINEKLKIGLLVRGHKRQILFTYNVLAEGINSRVFYRTLDIFKHGLDMTDQQINTLMSTT
ncbi:MAG: hypothetical protein HN366_12170 [Deltaproteobacteria bacterium]|jgi:hypothetical protein|nr:hypothetical protein [Deltaproteobacteria bacterium]